MKIKRALVSVTDKTNLDQLSGWFINENIEVISSGGTGTFLKELGVAVIPIQEITGNPEAFGGRMKTLSFQVGSALLYRRGHEEDVTQAKSLNIKAIDLVICNLYPFEKVSKETRDLDILVENIDIGGPTMIRSAAKNFSAVTVLTDPRQYQRFLSAYKENNGTSLEERKKFSLEAFHYTANYDAAISSVLSDAYDERSESPLLDFESESQKLRYGENPHQEARVYSHRTERGLVSVRPIQGKELSYNNYLDADAAFRSLSDIISLKNDELTAAVTVVKHSNSCGAALSHTSLKALEMAWNGDPISSFGSIICFNGVVDEDCAEFLNQRFVEVVIAPSFSQGALEIFSKKKNLRLLELSPSSGMYSTPIIRSVYGGVLVQDEDCGMDKEFSCVSKTPFDDSMMDLARFGVFATKHLKSNAISLVCNGDDGLQLIGAGMGNPNRLISLEQAVHKARANGFDDLSKAILVSDAFFPFRDNIDLIKDFGIKHLVQPGGSIKDKEVVAACDEFSISMLFTGRRHFRH